MTGSVLAEEPPRPPRRAPRRSGGAARPPLVAQLRSHGAADEPRRTRAPANWFDGEGWTDEAQALREIAAEVEAQRSAVRALRGATE